MPELLFKVYGLPRGTVYNTKVYIPAFEEKEFRGRRYLWPTPQSFVTCNWIDDALVCRAPQNSIIYFEHTSGSRKHVYYCIVFLAKVKPMRKAKVVVKQPDYDFTGGKEVELEVENLEIVADASILDNAKLLEQIMEEGYALSQRELMKLRNVLAFLLKKEEEKEAEEKEKAEVEETAVATEEIGKKILESVENVELEFEEAKTTAVAKEETEPRKQELVKIYLLKMKLPSKYLVQQIKIVKNSDGWQEVRDFSSREVAAVASRLEGIRRKAYELIGRHFVYVESYNMWVAVTEEAVRKAREVAEWVKKELESMPVLAKIKGDIVARYTVKAIPIWMEPSEARELLLEAIKLLESEIQQLQERIRRAEEARKKSALRRLEQQLAYKQALLEAFKKYLSTLS